MISRYGRKNLSKVGVLSTENLIHQNTKGILHITQEVRLSNLIVNYVDQPHSNLNTQISWLEFQKKLLFTFQ
jgi:hypothetical protein